MEAEIHAYWQQRLNEACAQRDELCDHLRGEVGHLQNRCQEMAQINAMGVAKVCFDIQDWAYANAALTPNGTPALALEDVVNFLHQYSNGIVPHYVRQNKRDRSVDDDSDAPSMPSVFGNRTVTSVPVTPTIAQLLAQRAARGGASSTMASSSAPHIAVAIDPRRNNVDDSQTPGENFETPQAATTLDENANQCDAASADGAAVAVQQFATCAHQHFVKAQRAVDPHSKRPRGQPLDDECTQLTPWSFCRTP